MHTISSLHIYIRTKYPLPSLPPSLSLPLFLFILPFPKSDLSTPLVRFPRKTPLHSPILLPLFLTPNPPKLLMILDYPMLQNNKKIYICFTLRASRKDLWIMQQDNSQKQNLERQLPFTSPKPPFGGDYHSFDADFDKGKPNQVDDQVVVVKTPPVSSQFLIFVMLIYLCTLFLVSVIEL